ncbi:MAG: glycosyltransferase family A protein [Steroidobacteraceae bacterium]|nr:glycosyltransferase family A protein [Steroidobacteraceae bacterium]
MIIAAYNAETTLLETLDSVLAQDVPGLRVFVVDDGSTDGTAATVASVREQWSNVHYLRRENSGTCSVPRNDGMTVADAPLVCFFDADDLMPPGRLAHQVAVIGRRPGVVAVVGDYRNFRDGVDFAATHFESCPELLQEWAQRGDTEVLELDEATFKRVIVPNNFSITGTVLYRRAVVDEVGRFDATLPSAEDFDLLWRVAARGTVAVTRFESMRRRLHGGNMTRKSSRMFRNRARSRLKIAAGERDPAVRRALYRHAAQCLAAAALADIQAGEGVGFQPMLAAVRLGVRHGCVPWRGLALWPRRLAGRALRTMRGEGARLGAPVTRA